MQLTVRCGDLAVGLADLLVRVGLRFSGLLPSFLGRLDRGEILEVFANTDLFLQPSVKESFGLAALEARSAGLPIIARSQTGTTQFVREGQMGILTLAALAAVMAMIPLSRSVFFGPMAVAIMGGLIVATVLTLLALPAMYAAWFRVPKPE